MQVVLRALTQCFPGKQIPMEICAREACFWDQHLQCEVKEADRAEGEVGL
jgi:hypothetical protein